MVNSGPKPENRPELHVLDFVSKSQHPETVSIITHRDDKFYCTIKIGEATVCFSQSLRLGARAYRMCYMRIIKTYINARRCPENVRYLIIVRNTPGLFLALRLPRSDYRFGPPTVHELCYIEPC